MAYQATKNAFSNGKFLDRKKWAPAKNFVDKQI